MSDPKHTYALVSEKGWVHAVFNDEDRANEQAEKRSVPLDQVNPDKGLHCYSVVRYIPAESAKAEAQPAGTGWVSVEERLPEDLRVLFLLKGVDLPCFGWWDGTLERWFDVETDGQNDYIEYGPGEVTHWQPLPPPPERDR